MTSLSPSLHDSLTPSEISHLETSAASKIIISLRMFGLGEITATKAFLTFGESTEEELKENPYILMVLEGVGFTKADVIAKNAFSIKDEDPRRQRALILKTLTDHTSLGHSFLPITILEKALKKEKILSSDESLKILESAGMIRQENNRIYIRKLWEAEVGIAQNIKERILYGGVV